MPLGITTFLRQSNSLKASFSIAVILYFHRMKSEYTHRPSRNIRPETSRQWHKNFRFHRLETELKTDRRQKPLDYIFINSHLFKSVIYDCCSGKERQAEQSGNRDAKNNEKFMSKQFTFHAAHLLSFPKQHHKLLPNPLCDEL